LNNVEQLIIDMKESLEREIRSGFHDMGVRLDNQASRMERHGALLQTGNRWIARLNDWSEKIDRSLEEKDRQISALSERLRKLEGEKGTGAQ
jgi:hypothetical protein